jgi:tRNA(fMet)-specific endonuclease VapC
MFPAIKARMQSFSPDRIKIPAIVKAELLLGAQQSQSMRRVYETVEALLGPYEVIPFCTRCAEIYPRIRSELEREGQPTGPNDLIIASTVFTNHGTLVTHNTREYGRIPNLKIQDWTEEGTV